MMTKRTPDRRKVVVELFAGSATFTKEARRAGLKAVSTDLVNYGSIDVVGSLLDDKVFRQLVRLKPDVIWASPPCTGFSIASAGKSFHTTILYDKKGKPVRTYFPKSQSAALGIALALRTWEYIDAVTKARGGEEPVYYIENPRGLMGKVGLMDRAPILRTITQCSYGHVGMKPTSIWTNNIHWTPRAMCRNGGWGTDWFYDDAGTLLEYALDREGNKCHQIAVRGAKTGTQGIDGAHGRATLPVELCREVIVATVQQGLDFPEPKP